MNLNRFLSRVVVIAFLAAAGAQASEMGQVCAKLAKEKGPAAFLVDQKGELVSGPVSFGRYAAPPDRVSDYEIAATPYRLLLIPRKIVASSVECNMCVHLKKIAAGCRNATIYEIGVGLSFSKPGGTRPFKEEANFNLQFDDPDDVYPPAVKLNFQPKITGELYDPASKK